MNKDRETAKYLNCALCKGPVTRKIGTFDFYSCKDPKHGDSPYFISPKFNNESGVVDEAPVQKRKPSLRFLIREKLRRLLL